MNVIGESILVGTLRTVWNIQAKVYLFNGLSTSYALFDAEIWFIFNCL